jgi:hypothetical protein
VQAPSPRFANWYGLAATSAKPYWREYQNRRCLVTEPYEQLVPLYSAIRVRNLRIVARLNWPRHSGSFDNDVLDAGYSRLGRRFDSGCDATIVIITDYIEGRDAAHDLPPRPYLYRSVRRTEQPVIRQDIVEPLRQCGGQIMG